MRADAEYLAVIEVADLVNEVLRGAIASVRPDSTVRPQHRAFIPPQ